MQIHIARSGQKFGPYSLEEVNQQLAAGTLTASDQAWYEGAAAWMPLTAVPGVTLPGSGGAAPSAAPFVPSPPVYSAPSTSPAFAPTTPYAGFWIRFVAYLIDGIILGIAGGFVTTVFLHLGSDNSSGAAGGLVTLVNVLFGFFYFTALWSSEMQASLGQKILGLQVTTTSGGRLSFPNAMGRYFALVLSFMILFIGVIMVAFTERKQGLHDLLASTYVVKPR